MSIIPQKKGNRKSDESNFYFSVLLSKNLYPEIVRMERFEICWRMFHRQAADLLETLDTKPALLYKEAGMESPV